MITLKGAGEAFGLPHASPFVTRTEVHLKMAGLAYRAEPAAPMESPKGQIPFIVLDDGQVVADSAFIRMHIEAEHGVDFDAGLTPEQRAQAYAVELAVEQLLIPAYTYFRWLVPANFEKGPAHFFDGMPADQREAFKASILERVRASMTARGIARHSEIEIAHLALRALKMLDVLIGEKDYLMGDEPCGADAIVFAALMGAMTPFFDSPVREMLIRMPRLVAYVGRMVGRFYPDFAWDVELPAMQQAA
jgi:glutathione S-transferase